MAVIIGLFWFLAVAVFVVTQWVVPTFYISPTSTTSGFNYGTTFGLPVIKTWGLWIAGFLFVLGPIAAVWRAIERGGEAVMGRALGTSNSRRKK